MNYPLKPEDVPTGLLTVAERSDDRVVQDADVVTFPRLAHRTLPHVHGCLVRQGRSHPDDCGEQARRAAAASRSAA